MSTAANALANATWVATWAGPIARHTPETLKPIRHQTLRHRVEASVGGEAVRIVLSNEYGTRPLSIGRASVATLSADGVESSPVPLPFGGQPGIDIAVGATALSNEVELPVTPGQFLLVKVHLPGECQPESAVLLSTDLPTDHPLHYPQPEWWRADLSSEGDFTDVVGLPDATRSHHMPFLSRVEVRAHERVTTVAVHGTSFTDGLDVWPDHLSRRLNTEAGQERWSIVNLSARGGNMSRGYSHSGREGVIALFDQEVLSIPGLSHVVLSDARHDISASGPGLNADGSAPEGATESGDASVTVESLKAAYRQLIARGHVRGVKVLAATMPPFRGVPAPGYYSEQKEAMRVDLNEWIRDSGEFDGVIDIDALMRDPADHGQYTEEYRHSSKYGPNQAGHRAIAASIDPAIFEKESRS